MGLVTLGPAARNRPEGIPICNRFICRLVRNDNRFCATTADQ